MGCILPIYWWSEGAGVCNYCKARISASPLLTYIVGNAQEELFLAEVLGQQKWMLWWILWCIIPPPLRAVMPLYYMLHTSICSLASRVYADSKEPLTETSVRLLTPLTIKYSLSTDEYPCKSEARKLPL